MSITENSRNIGERLNVAKSYVRLDEAEKRLKTVAGLIETDDPFDYFIWVTPKGRHVPVWVVQPKYHSLTVQADEYGVSCLRR